jgi:hypothetical protein
MYYIILLYNKVEITIIQGQGNFDIGVAGTTRYIRTFPFIFGTTTEYKGLSPRQLRIFCETVLTVFNRVGWFWTFFYILNNSTPEICNIPTKSTENTPKKILTHLTASSLITTILGHALYKGQKFFIHNMDFMGIKRILHLLIHMKSIL